MHDNISKSCEQECTSTIPLAQSLANNISPDPIMKNISSAPVMKMPSLNSAMEPGSLPAKNKFSKTFTTGDYEQNVYH